MEIMQAIGMDGKYRLTAAQNFTKYGNWRNLFNDRYQLWLPQ
jgi:hypothetical protein